MTVQMIFSLYIMLGAVFSVVLYSFLCWLTNLEDERLDEMLEDSGSSRGEIQFVVDLFKLEPLMIILPLVLGWVPILFLAFISWLYEEDNRSR